ncbi:ATP-dependent endonuclease [Marinilabiliaceae bacterium JC040]|nr:ATP-dependent endonuclease [Marinilabiliaceae bacterium JC040]
MYISKVSLVNYRNFASENFKFNKGINTIIGENGSGKTNLFRAMRLLLEDSSYQYAYKLNENDFNRNLKDWRGHWIIISMEFSELSSDEAIQSLFVHGFGVIDKDCIVDKAAYNLFFRPKKDIRLKLSELKEGDKDGLAKILNNITIKDDYETFFSGKSIVDFNDEEVYKDLVGDFDKVKFKANIDTSKYGIKIPHQLSIAKEISFTFIKALRDVVSDFHNNRTNPLLSLLRSKSGDIDDTDFAPIKEIVNNLNEKIETLPDVHMIRNDIKETINDAVGETYSPAFLSIKSSLSNEADRLLQSLRLFIAEPNESYEGDIHELSLGGANLIFLTLKLLEYKYQKSKETFANFLLIEEPEAHIHTHIQKTLFENLDYGDTQIIYSTHSTHISDVSNVSNMNILGKKQNSAEVFQPSNGLETEELMKVQRYLDAVRSNLLFAKGVILVEGDAEEILIPKMIKEIFGISLDELGISLINIRSTGFKNVAQLFHEDRIRRRCSIITDLDDAICDVTVNVNDSDSVAKYKKKVKRSMDKGQERRIYLNNFSNGNKWIEIFYAEHTFEVDFIKAKNTFEVEKLVDVIYVDGNTIIDAKSDINSNDVSRYGKRVLTMANREGKGWFAIMLGEYISYKTIIPKYILKAIIFAKSSFSQDLICKFVEYKIKKYSKDDDIDFTDVINAIDEYRRDATKIDSLITKLEIVIPEDSVVTFLKLL